MVEKEPLSGFPLLSGNAPLKNPEGSAVTAGRVGTIGVDSEATASLEPTRKRKVPEFPTPGNSSIGPENVNTARRTAGS